MPSLEARDLDKKIREERSRYLVAELICKVSTKMHALFQSNVKKGYYSLFYITFK